jgi:putative ABC transport system permease protein
MILSDTVQLALRNLRQSKLRTTLTAMGVSIGIASLAGMVSLGVGIQDQVVGRLMKSGVFDSITVFPGNALRNAGPFGRGGGPARRGAGGGGARAGASGTPEKPAPALDDEAIKAIAALPDVKAVYPVVRVPVEVRYGLFAEGAAATSVDMSQNGEGPYQKMAFGTFFPSDRENVCLLSLDMAKRMTDHDAAVAGEEPKDLIGKNVTLVYASTSGAPAGASGTVTSTVNVGPVQIQRIEIPYRVVGIFEREQGGFGGGGAAGLMIPLARAMTLSTGAINVSAQSFLRGSGADGPAAANAANAANAPAASAPAAKTYQTLTVKVQHAQASQDVEDKIKTLGYSAFSLSDALTAAKRGFIILDIMLSLIGSIALVVSSLGIVNTMVMSILERTREIGIMKAVGGSDADVRNIFLVEASSIGILGGLVGVAIGWTVGRIINFAANWYIKSQGGDPGNLFSLPLWLVAGSIGFAIVVSLIAGSYPARSAARLDPIQALRHD